MVTVVALTATGIASFVIWDGFQRFTENSVELPSDNIAQIPPQLSFEAYPGEVNFLLTGTDECTPDFAEYFGDRCNGEEDGARNDVTLLVHIPEDHARATVISFPRDLMLEFPDCTSTSGARISGGGIRQLNTSYDMGGLGCVASVVEEISGFQIPFAAKINWGGVINVTDNLGGVDICVANGIYDVHTGLALEPGTHTLQGLEALQFLRTRHGLSGGSDLARISNQQLYMAALLKKITTNGSLEDFMGLMGSANVIIKNLEHSTSLNEPSTLVSLALLLRELPLDTITFLQIPTVTDPNDPNRVVEDPYATDEFWEAIRNQQDVGIKNGVDSTLIEEPAPEEMTPSESPLISAPGMKAELAGCANGAG